MWEVCVTIIQNSSLSTGDALLTVLAGPTTVSVYTMVLILNAPWLVAHAILVRSDTLRSTTALTVSTLTLDMVDVLRIERVSLMKVCVSTMVLLRTVLSVVEFANIESSLQNQQTPQRQNITAMKQSRIFPGMGCNRLTKSGL